MTIKNGISPLPFLNLSLQYVRMQVGTFIESLKQDVSLVPDVPTKRSCTSLRGSSVRQV